MQLKMARVLGVLVLSVAGALVAAPTPAVASNTAPIVGIEAYSTCYVTSFLVTSCKTATIHANTTYHDLYYQACAASSHYADWQVKDASNGVIVGQGRVDAGQCRSGYIRGLYGSYWGWVFNTRRYANMTISD
jgi:hypothetical protein